MASHSHSGQRRRVDQAGRLVAWLLLAVCPPASAWTAGLASDPVSREQHCLLQSEAETTSDGYGQTPVTLVLNERSLMVVTKSAIDSSFSDLTLAVDREQRLKADRIERDNVVVFEQDFTTILEQFKAGQWATVSLRFWPTWPATQSFPVKFTLIGFTKAYESLATCGRPSPATSAG